MIPSFYPQLITKMHGTVETNDQSIWSLSLKYIEREYSPCHVMSHSQCTCCLSGMTTGLHVKGDFAFGVAFCCSLHSMQRKYLMQQHAHTTPESAIPQTRIAILYYVRTVTASDCLRPQLAHGTFPCQQYSRRHKMHPAVSLSDPTGCEAWMHLQSRTQIVEA